MPLTDARVNTEKMEIPAEATEVIKEAANLSNAESKPESDGINPSEVKTVSAPEVDNETTEGLVNQVDSSAENETAVENCLTEMDVDEKLTESETSIKESDAVVKEDGVTEMNEGKDADTTIEADKSVGDETVDLNKTVRSLRRRSDVKKPTKQSDDESSEAEEMLDKSEEGFDESMVIEEEEEDDDDNKDADDDDKSKCSRELKLLLELSKEANLNTNISHKRKSVDPKKMFDDSPEDVKKEKTVSPERKSNSSPISTVKRKSITSSVEKPIGKKIKKEVELDLDLIKKGKDPFCWRCHKNMVYPSCGLVCNTCPRSFHFRCLKQEVAEPWQCPECVNIVKAENLKTRSPSLKSMDLKHLCSLLKFALKRMIQVADCEPFMHPVPAKYCPDYRNYIVYPMDLTMMQKNIDDNVYGSTDAFESDTKWILHNSIVYNSYNRTADQSKLTSTAKYIEKICKQEMTEIENCSNCYLNANTKSDWFVEVCPKPHILIWAKLKGFPYWPAKAMVTNKYGMVDVRFFGAHDRAWVSHKDCYLYSQKNPNQHQMKKYNIKECITEVEVYVENLRKQFGVFKYAPFKARFDPDKDYLKLFLPNYVPPDGRKTSARKSPRLDKSPEPAEKPVAAEKVVRNLSKEIDEEEERKKADEKNENEQKVITDESTEIVEDDKKPTESVNDEKTEEVVEEKPIAETPDEKANDAIIEENVPDKEEEPINETIEPPQVSTEETKTEIPPETPKEETEEVKKVEQVVDADKPIEPEIVETKEKEEKVVDVKKDYEENDLLEVLYAEDVNGSKLHSKKKCKLNGEAQLLSDLKENLSKALTVAKKMKQSDSPIEEKPCKMKIKSDIQDMLKDKGDLDVTIKPKQAPEKNKLEKTIDSIAKGHGTIKAPSEPSKKSKSNSVFRPDLLLKHKKVETVKLIKNKRKSGKDDDDEGGERLKKRKLSVDSVGKKQDEITITKCDAQKDDKKSKVKPQAESGSKEVPFENAEQRELFQALNISEKGIEVEKPKVHEIRTRSKTEEMFPNAFKQRARKSFPKTKSPPLNKDVQPVVKTVGVPNKIVTPTSQNVLLVPAPLLFQGANNNQLIAMVSPSNSSYAFVQQGAKIVNRNLVKNQEQNKSSVEKKPGGSLTLPELRVISNEVSLTRKVKPAVEEKSGAQQSVISLTSSAVADPLNPSELTVLNGVIGSAVPSAIKDLFNRPPPLLKPRPPGPLRAEYDEGVPSSAGPWTAKINSISHKLSDYLRGMLIETLNDVSTTTEDPEALVASLQLEIESLKAKHAEEVLEIKKNVNSILQDIQKSIVEEREKITNEVRAQCAVDALKRVEEAKTKQWCANCMKEAQFYCCWNTSYCDYPCQTKHWPKHMSKCTQNSQSSQGTPQIVKGTQQIVLRPVLPPRGFSGGKPILSKQPTKILMGKATSSVRTSAPSITLIESLPGNFEVITNGQIVDGAKIVSTPPKVKQKSLLSSTAGGATKTIILQSTNAPVMTPIVTTPEKKANDPLAI